MTSVVKCLGLLYLLSYWSVTFYSHNMFRIAIVIFRETVEIAIILAMILAVTRNIKNSKIFVLSGVILGVTVSSLFALFIQNFSTAFSGLGDEVVDAFVMLVSSLVTTWTVLWMNEKYTPDAFCSLRSSSNMPLAITSLVSVLLIREAIEIIMLVYSVSAVTDISVDQYIVSVFIGFICAALVGLLVYRSSEIISKNALIKIASWCLTILSAVLASEAAAIFSSLGMIEIYHNKPLWNSSIFISNESYLGHILRSVVGYVANPNAAQVLGYLSPFVIIQVSRLVSSFRRKNQVKI
ncbi:FTR1 family protein [Candidatus Sarmatiella mevalonica]|uniref:FTR1 family protein n=1 Tax=Candidatus Sarmatiella mevalonica TaxID=2770581 RepID=UPI0019243E67|nr:FTR1 family protein [Candidatus Sarmatiella mevalonica]